MNKNKKMTKQTIDFILAFCGKLRKEREEEKLGRGKWENIEGSYITFTMLMGIYKVLINEGYTREHLNNFFFFDDEPDKHKEQTEKACEVYHILTGWKDPSRAIKEFFNENPAGIKLRMEIDKLSEKFNQ